MIRVFARSRQMVGVASVGCCYMKLSVGRGEERGEEGGGTDGDWRGERMKDGGGGLGYGGGEREEGGESLKGGEEEGEGVEGEGGEEEGEGLEREGGKEEGEGLEERGVEGEENRGQRVRGYPMSQFQEKGCVQQLSYAARELACHSVATYCDRFQGERSFSSHTLLVPPKL